MTTPLLIALATVAVFAVLKAAKDTTNDYWERSVFYRLAGGDREHFFGHRDHVYRRRNGSLFRVPILSNVLEAVYDFWHLASTIQVALIIIALVALGGLAWWWGLVMWALYYVAFEGARRVIA